MVSSTFIRLIKQPPTRLKLRKCMLEPPLVFGRYTAGCGRRSGRRRVMNLQCSGYLRSRHHGRRIGRDYWALFVRKLGWHVMIRLSFLGVVSSAG